MSTKTNSAVPNSNARRPAAKKLVLVIVLIGTASAVGYGGGNIFFRWYHGAESALNKPQLMIADNELHLGRVHEMSACEHRIHITNVTSLPLTILRFQTSCDCLGIVPDTNVGFQPGETRSFTIKLRLLSRQPDKAQEDPKPFSVQFGAVYSWNGQAQSSARWELDCVIVPTIRLNPAVIHLGTESCRSTMIERSVAIEATKEIQWIDHEDPPNWSVEITEDPAAASPHKFKMIVRTRGRLMPRPVSDVIRLYPVGPDEKRLPAKELQIQGEIAQDVVAFPQGFHHGRQTRGKEAKEAIQLRSLTGRPFQVKAVIPKGEGLDISSMPSVPDGRVYSLRLRFARLGEQKVEAGFVILNDDGTECEITVPIRYYGLSET